MSTTKRAGWPCRTVMSASAAMRKSLSFTETRVFTSDRKRTSLGTTDATTSRVVHQMVAGWPGTRAASIVVWPPEEERAVIRPGLMQTLARSLGTTSVILTLAAEGTARLKEAQ